MSVEDIANEIRRHNKLYAEGKPEITDTEYDSLVGMMKYIDPKNEVLQEVGAPISYGKKVKHEIPMGSLDKIKCQLDKDGNPMDGHGAQELEDWVRKVDEIVCFSPKIDGLAGELVYEKGILVQASTRGDGCLAYDSIIEFEDGRKIPIGKIYELNIKGKVKCLNIKSNKIEYKEIKNVFLNDNKHKFIDLYVNINGKEVVLKCTENHQILTSSGWKQAKDIDVDEEIIVE